jgi:hypothetical protein
MTLTDKIRLNGWQRLWIFISVLYGLAVACYVYQEVRALLDDDVNKKIWGFYTSEEAMIYREKPFIDGIPSECDAYADDFTFTPVYEADSSSGKANEEFWNSQKLELERKEKRCRQIISASQSAFYKKYGYRVEWAGYFLHLSLPSDDSIKIKNDLTNAQVRELKSVIRQLDENVERVLMEEQALALGRGLLIWIAPMIALYVFGAGIGWVYKGFRSN